MSEITIQITIRGDRERIDVEQEAYSAYKSGSGLWRDIRKAAEKATSTACKALPEQR